MVDSLSAEGRGNVSQGRLVLWRDKARFMRWVRRIKCFVIFIE